MRGWGARRDARGRHRGATALLGGAGVDGGVLRVLESHRVTAAPRQHVSTCSFWESPRKPSTPVSPREHRASSPRVSLPRASSAHEHLLQSLAQPLQCPQHSPLSHPCPHQGPPSPSATPDPHGGDVGPGCPPARPPHAGQRGRALTHTLLPASSPPPVLSPLFPSQKSTQRRGEILTFCLEPIKKVFPQRRKCSCTFVCR